MMLIDRASNVSMIHTYKHLPFESPKLKFFCIVSFVLFLELRLGFSRRRKFFRCGNIISCSALLIGNALAMEVRFTEYIAWEATCFNWFQQLIDLSSCRTSEDCISFSLSVVTWFWVSSQFAASDSKCQNSHAFPMYFVGPLKSQEWNTFENMQHPRSMNYPTNPNWSSSTMDPF